MAGFVSWNPAALFTAVDDRIAATMNMCGERMVARAKQLVPVRTGRTRDAIVFHYHRSTRELILVADAPASIFLEFGTIYMPARPFLRPAIAEAAAVWGGKVPNLGMAFYHAPKLKSDIANPRTARHHANQAFNRATSVRFNKGAGGKARQYIRSHRGGEGS